mmetsp:Transcript_54992/g.146815  ORF Transcript_54992/g.146815 Transcript_54992/m.146815 type:complete len:233 (+) Transcript_54992:608-1306(+)
MDWPTLERIVKHRKLVRWALYRRPRLCYCVCPPELVTEPIFHAEMVRVGTTIVQPTSHLWLTLKGSDVLQRHFSVVDMPSGSAKSDKFLHGLVARGIHSSEERGLPRVVHTIDGVASLQEEVNHRHVAIMRGLVQGGAVLVVFVGDLRTTRRKEPHQLQIVPPGCLPQRSSHVGLFTKLKVHFQLHSRMQLLLEVSQRIGLTRTSFGIKLYLPSTLASCHWSRAWSFQSRCR